MDTVHDIAYIATYKMGDEPQIEFFTNFNVAMHHVCELIAFDDFNEVRDVKLVAVTDHDTVYEIHYCGWLPDMEMKWVKAHTDEVVWDCYYPEWDH